MNRCKLERQDLPRFFRRYVRLNPVDASKAEAIADLDGAAEVAIPERNAQRIYVGLDPDLSSILLHADDFAPDGIGSTD